MANEVFPTVPQLILPYDGILPRLATEPRSCGPGVSLLGKVQIGAWPAFGPGTVIRADGHFVRIGDNFRIGEMSTVHIAHEVYPAIIGDRVTVGRNAVVHACTVGNDCVIEDGVVILDGSIVEDGVLIEAGSTVFPRSRLISGTIYSGSPAKPAGSLLSGERERRELYLREGIVASPLSAEALDPGEAVQSVDDVFVGRTARLSGRIDVGAQSSVYFGCHLDAGENSIVIGRNSNIQDNTHVDASEGPVIIGQNTTIGHNVNLRACRIGEQTLIGIGSDIGIGVVIDDDVLLAGGSTTLPGQHLEGGWLWGGRPARPIAALNETKRAMMRPIIEIYCAYSAAYRRAQDSSMGEGGSTRKSAVTDDQVGCR